MDDTIYRQVAIDEFNIGDKVIRNYRNSLPTTIGTVVNITKKRRDIVVDYGNYKETYRSDGWQRGGDIWMRSTIQLLTPEIEEEIRKINLIQKCRSTFEEKKDLTVDQAERILVILAEGTKGRVMTIEEFTKNSTESSSTHKALDTISRQAAIEAIDTYIGNFDAIDANFLDGLKTAKKLMMQLPSAQPEIIRCKDCKHYQFADNRAFGMPVKMCKWFGFEDVDDNDFCSRAERRTDG